MCVDMYLYSYFTLRVCPQEHQVVVLHAISQKPTPLVFLGFHQGHCSKVGKMYEALTKVVFNQLL